MIKQNDWKSEPILAATVKTVDELTDWLQSLDFKIEKYHGRLKASERNQNQEAFMAGELKAIVATNAFGMGIDKPDIRFVVHYQMPGSLEAYYQESGRAGATVNFQAVLCFISLAIVALSSFSRAVNIRSSTMFSPSIRRFSQCELMKRS